MRRGGRWLLRGGGGFEGDFLRGGSGFKSGLWGVFVGWVSGWFQDRF